MTPDKHIVISVSLGAVFWVITKSLTAGALCALGGFIIDIDHGIEYVWRFGVKRLTVKRILAACKQTYEGKEIFPFYKLHLFFHSFELAIIFVLISVIAGSLYLMAFSIGFSSHLIIDAVFNKRPALFYFLLWRMKNGFVAQRLLYPKDHDKH
jgi:hypothetical protein